ncbi:MAG: SDR family NAD(P)-dependent oxidoreductase [Ignavibacteria bacterium]|nr:SDR family NAD(P)-dependent oxidoreductase [Ignavibacteria bacterium]
MEDLKNKYGSWALITGASSGIGEEFAKVLASKGINLLLVARRKERLQKLSDELISLYGIEVVISNVDLTSEKFLDQIIRDVDEREISILINNAGIGKPGEFVDEEMVYDIDLIKINCLAPLVLANYFGKKMIRGKKGAILFLGSIVAYQPTPYMASYAATKSFNYSLGNSLWHELKNHGIDVLTINPGNTSTEFNRMVLNDQSVLTRTAQQVVATSLKALGRKPNVVDGFINKIITVLARVGSVRLITFVTGKIMYRLYQQNHYPQNQTAET